MVYSSLANGGVTTTGWGGLTQDVTVPGDYDGDREDRRSSVSGWELAHHSFL